MCGIAGYFGAQEIPQERVQACHNWMHRRGPDAKGLFHQRTKRGNHIYLLHSRLNIIDCTDRANQPFSFGPQTMAFNGELYNYLELKQVLSAKGHTFKTTSDTEVFLHTLREFGTPQLDACEGMWAFALYNEKEETLLLSRDRFGEKPLYYYKDASGIYFGSEIKFIFALLGRSLPIHYDALWRILIYGYKFIYKQSSCLYRGIEELPRAHCLLVKADLSETKWSYWNPVLDVSRQSQTMTYEEAVEGAKVRLIDSVKIRLRADVPIAFCMSGGIDSNALISIAKKSLGYDVHGFTIQNSDPRYNETELIDYSVKELGIRHTYIPLQTDHFLTHLKELIHQHDGPVYTLAYYTQWLLMRSVAEHGYRISISGTASDELFTGYYDHHLAYLAEVRNNPALFQKSLAGWQQNVLPYVRNPHLSNPNLFIDQPDFRDHLLLNCEDFQNTLVRPWREPFREETFTHDLLRNRMLNEMFHENVPAMLHMEDLNAMYFSIENRSPFLDRRLFEYCQTIPTRHLISEGRAKIILRDAMKGIVPEKILLNTRKIGFNAPLFSLFDVKDPHLVESILNPSPVYDFIKRNEIEALLKKDYLPNSMSKFLFSFLNVKIFLEGAGKTLSFPARNAL